jgi:NTP pyrophosphatase (non-canonical NTP hydrolase)
MDLSAFQVAALRTDQFSNEQEKILHPVLNLIESVGALHRIVEQGHRDKSLSEEYGRQRISRKIGDILWYVSNIASRTGVDLSAAAAENLQRTEERWGKAKDLRGKHFDELLPVYERLPRKFRVAFFEPDSEQKPRKIMIAVPSDADEWIQVGDRIDDNADKDDGYRFHDVLHLAHAAYLGWSPVIRALLRRKRKSDPEADRVQDGARAINIEEALTAFIFAHAEQQKFFQDAEHVDFGLLKTVERLTLGLEVRHRSYEEWETAILKGFQLFRALRDQKEGLVMIDLTADPEQRLVLETLPAGVKSDLLKST